MSTKLALSADLRRKIAAFRDSLDDLSTEFLDEFDGFITDMQEAIDERSERWQESDRADDASTWIDELEGIKDNVEALLDAASELSDQLDSLPSEPEWTS